MEVRLTKKQAEYIREAHHRWNFAVGAVRSGKSFLALQYIIPKCLIERHGKRGLNFILGATQTNIKRNVLDPMRDIWGSNLVGNIGHDNIARLFGEDVYCIGGETKRTTSRLRGSEIKFCYCDEIVDLHHETFDMLKSRLSLSYSECHVAANPTYPSHYIKKFLDSEGIDLYQQKYTIYDNPFLPESYIRNLEAEYAGTIYYKRYILGEWALAEGLIYPNYQNAVADIPDGIPEELCLSVDYGTLNPFAALLWERFGKTWYAVKEYYYNGRDEMYLKTDSDYVDDLAYWLKTEIEMLRGQKLLVIIDPSAASFIALLKRSSWAKVVKADNEVLAGIRETATAQQKGYIKYSKDLVNWRNESETYVWDKECNVDRPIKQNDHLMDAQRYFVKTKRIVKPQREFNSLWMLR